MKEISVKSGSKPEEKDQAKAIARKNAIQTEVDKFVAAVGTFFATEC